MPKRFSPSEDEKIIELVAANSILWNTEDKEFKNQVKKDIIWMEIGKVINKSEFQCKQRWKNIRDHFRKQRKHETGAITGSAAPKKRAAYWDRLSFPRTVADERETFSNTVPCAPIHAESPEIEMTEVDPLEVDLLQLETVEVETLEAETLEVETPEAAVAEKDLGNISNYDSRAARNPDMFATPGSSKRPVNKRKKDTTITDFLKTRREDRLLYQKYLDQIIEPESDDDTDLFFKTMAATVKKFNSDLISEAKLQVFKIVMDLEVSNRQFNRNNVSASNDASSSYSTSSSQCSTPHTNESNNFHEVFSYANDSNESN